MRDFAQAVSDGVYNLVSWAIITLAGGGVWIVRRILTNQKQIEMLQHHLDEREKEHGRDREEFRRDIEEVKSDVKEINKNLITLFQLRK